ncbi:MAG TPA: enolase C-terminal domain-like protein [Thermoanaerobaculia bacterium]|jgi:L-alanine-DL-glutamate epimerase-like enolase superfamily enzyme|nr:enolase C-terminal domain-like protein [Thermoanaerobaculia bacterium]
MRIVDIRERTVPLSRYADPAIAPGDLTTSVVALVTDVRREGAPVVGYGFSSIGRFGQGGLIRERFAPRLLAAGTLDPLPAWDAMMAGEKPGGHGERCVAVGTLDMALWDAAAKIAGQPLYRFLADRTGREGASTAVPVYAAGGYPYPVDDVGRLTDEVRRFLDAGYTHVKIKIGGRPLSEDLRRIEAVLALLPGGGHLAVDAMNRYTLESGVEAAQALAPYKLQWFEDICDPLDFETQAQIARAYDPPIAAGEALFSLADARNLIRYGGLRPDRDLLVFDPVHTYGLPEYLRILDLLESHGWPRSACRPHGGHLFCLHVVTVLGLGGAESNPLSFQPFGGFADDIVIDGGYARPPEAPGIGFETRAPLARLFRSL